MQEFLASVADKLAEYGVEPTIRKAQYVFCVRKISKNLEDTKEELKLRRDSVQNRVKEAQMNTEKVEDAVHKWLNEVKILLEEVENLQQEMVVQNSRFQGWLPDWGRYRLCRQMDMKTKIMTMLINNSTFEPFSHRTILPGIEYFPSGGFTYFESTKLAYEQLLEAIRDDDIYMIGLYGMGGCGKTTLTKEVGRKAKELPQFDEVVFATVSQTPNVRRIQGEIADLLSLKLCEESEAGRARRLSLRLQSGERILIILDDVWSRLNLEDIGIPCGGSHRGCKVFLTTRRQQVCTLMKCQSKIQLCLLSEEEEFFLLQKHARIDDYSSSSLLYEVARAVAKECKGLPLAIEAVGTSLRGKSIDEWKIALDRLRDSRPVDIEEGEHDAFACLLLSYDYLRSSLAKSLFLMCGLFPEDHKISKEDLFRYGVGLGLCGDVKSFDIARSCVNVGINKLIDSCLLMHSEEGKDHVKMHDVVRDVALWVASREDRAIMVNVAKDLEAKAKDSFAVSSWSEKILQFPNQLNAPKLEMLLLQTGNDFELSNASFEGLKLLKVLAIISEDRGEVVLLSLPQSTYFLTNLQILRLVDWELGNISSLENLRGLEILDLHFSRFKQLPNGITKLNKLRLLDLSWCTIEEDCYEVAGRCSQLEELYAFVIIQNFRRMDSYECFLDDATFPKLQRYVL